MTRALALCGCPLPVASGAGFLRLRYADVSNLVRFQPEMLTTAAAPCRSAELSGGAHGTGLGPFGHILCGPCPLGSPRFGGEGRYRGGVQARRCTCQDPDR